MLSKLKKIRDQKSSDQGFTIIEVMIVLAIAGLIILIVFLAVPALQRSSRNTQRKNDASRVASLISEYVSNNPGATITGTTLGSALSGQTFSIITTPSSVVSYSSSLTAAPDAVKVVTGATCNGNSLTPSTSTHAIAVIYGLEGSATQGCATAD